ncbi:MAG: HXXEE domain-containing protein [Leucobacter sp.]
MKLRGPALLFAAWAVHDVEEALAFPATCDHLAARSGVQALRLDARQSWFAVGLMGIAVATACWQGNRTGGRSRLYRATVAGLEAHVYTHVAGSLALRRYTAGAATAVPVMLPGARVARDELRRLGQPLDSQDLVRGASLLGPAAVLSQLLARLVPRRVEGRSRTNQRTLAY